MENVKKAAAALPIRQAGMSFEEMRSGHANSVAAATDWAPSERMAAWCAEIAARLHWPAADCDLLDRAALLHSTSKLVGDQASWEALSQALGIAAHAESDAHYAEVREVLGALHGRRTASGRAKRLALVLEQVMDLDNACQLDAKISAEPDLNGLDVSMAEIARLTGAVTAAELTAAAKGLPVFPAVGHRADALLRNENGDLREIESLISSDPALAGHLIAAANSVPLGTRHRVTNIRQALVRMGWTAARRVTLAAALRGMFGKKHSYSLWNHSLDVAESAARLAARSGAVDTQDAFLAGLMHDVGKLAMLNLPAPVLASRDRLIERGCPDLVVERVFFGEAHTTLGARLLREWQFTESMASAVECHHQPERNPSPVCNLLYLAETATAHDPALPSEWRDALAYQSLGLQRTDAALLDEESTLVSGLRFAAVA
jgi:putative nucleotidyltransferase with HDIG domain